MNLIYLFAFQWLNSTKILVKYLINSISNFLNITSKLLSEVTLFDLWSAWAKYMGKSICGYDYRVVGSRR